jgi:hypothetical protein
LSKPNSNLRPGSSPNEDTATELLLKDDVMFIFSAVGVRQKITLSSLDPRLADTLVKLPKKGQTIELEADFARMVFIKPLNVTIQ